MRVRFVPDEKPDEPPKKPIAPVPSRPRHMKERLRRMEQADRKKQRFEERYANLSGFTIDELYANGMQGENCDCGDPRCCGWKMPNPQDDFLKKIEAKGRRHDMINRAAHLHERRK